MNRAVFDMSTLVTSDRDLLSLGKPFGIVVTPAEFNRRLAES